MITPINDNILIRRLQPQRYGLIHMPDSTVQKSFYGIIKDVGNKVKDTYLQKDLIVVVSPTSKKEKIGDFEYLIKERDILVIKHQGTIRPLGNRVLLRRLNQEIIQNGIIIPDCHESADQTLRCIVSQYGIQNGKVIQFEALGGEIVCLQKWDMSIIEIDIDGDYFLSVPTKLVAYVEHH